VYGGGVVERITRTGLLARVGGLVVASLGLGAFRPGSAPAASAVGCILATEGRPGTRLDVRLWVVDASTCAPISGAAVDIWHADAGGVYSGFGAGTSSRTFMRGIQRTDKAGLAQFRTVYPGWYQGRTVHIHVKVHVGGNVVHTGQLFFSDTLTDAVYRRSPYSRRSNRDTRNAHDMIYANGGPQSTLTVRGKSSGYVGSIVMGVRR